MTRILSVWVALVTATMATAQTYTWTGLGPNNQWATTANWSPIQNPPTTATVAFTAPTPFQTVNLVGTRAISGLIFGGTAAYTLTNGDISLSGGVTVTGTTGAAVEHVISVPVLLKQTVNTWSVATSNLRVTGAISQSASGSALTKTGNGTLTLAGANTYTGPTTISGGTLALPTGGSLTNTLVTVNAGGTLAVNGGSVNVGVPLNMTFDGSSTLAGVGSLTAGTVVAAGVSVGRDGSGAFTQTGGTFTASNYLSLGNNASGNGAYTLQGGTLSVNNSFVGDVGTGTFIQTGGTHTATGYLSVGDSVSTGYGSYTLGGTGQLTTNLSVVGWNGTGTFTQTGGTHAASGYLSVGNFLGGTGTYALGGTGQLSTTFSLVGAIGSGMFTQTGGTHVTSSLSLGDSPGGTGTYDLQGGTLSVENGFAGAYGSGTFTQTGGTLTASGYLSVGDRAGGTGNYTLSGTGQLATPSTSIGVFGTGTFTQTSGTHSVTGYLLMGRYAEATGKYTLGGTGQLSTTYSVIGSNGSGTFIQTGGTHNAGNYLSVGSQPDGIGDYTLGGTGRLSTGFSMVGEEGSGTFTQTGGIHNAGSYLVLGRYANGTGIYTLGGTGQLSTPATYLGLFGTGTFTQTGGTHTATGFVSLGLASSGFGVYTLEGGTLQTAAVNRGQGSGTFVFDGGTLRASGSSTTFFQGLTTATVRAGGAVIDTNGFAITVAQPLMTDPTLNGLPDGGLTKKGAGTLTLTGANTYTGGTTITGGVLSVSADANLGAATGTVTVQGAGRLVVTGTGFTTSRGLNLGVSTLSPAAGGTITLNGATVTGGTLSGGQFVTGTLNTGSTFVGVTTSTSATLTLGGADTLFNSNLGGATTVQASGFTPSLSATTVTPSGWLTLNSSAQLSVTDFVNTGLVTLADGPTAAQRTLLTNAGTTDLYFGGGSRTFVGTPANVANGLAGVNLGGRQAVVTGGLFVNNGIVGNGTVVADYGAIVKGSGTFTTPVLTQNGGRYQPGNSPGQATSGSFVFNGGGAFQFQINNATGVAGPVPDANNQVSGWSLQLARVLSDPFTGQATTGGLTVTATPASRYTLVLQTLQNPSTVGQDNFGAMANFDPTRPYSWTLLTYEGPYSGPADLNSVFAIDTSLFANGTAGGAFSIVHNTADHFVALQFTPVPEPVGLLMLLGMVTVTTALVRRWRRFAMADVNV